MEEDVTIITAIDIGHEVCHGLWGEGGEEHQINVSLGGDEAHRGLGVRIGEVPCQRNSSRLIQANQKVGNGTSYDWQSGCWHDAEDEICRGGGATGVNGGHRAGEQAGDGGCSSDLAVAAIETQAGWQSRDAN